MRNRKNPNIFQKILLFALICFTFGCNVDNSSSVEIPENKNIHYLLVEYLVKDAGVLKTVFKKYEQESKKLNIDIIHIFKEDTNKVYLLLKADNYSSAENFLSSPAFYSEITSSGAEHIKNDLYKMIEQNSAGPPDRANFLLITHLVTDMNDWKKIFDASEIARNAKGIETLKIFSQNDNPNDIVILFASSVDSALKHFISPGTSTVIKASGVIGDIDVKYLQPL